MKKSVLIIILVFAGIIARSQKIEDIRTNVLLSKFDKAKELVDKFLSDEKNAAKADAWYYKAVTYNALSRTATNALDVNKKLNEESYEALQKYKQLDPAAEQTVKEENSTYYNIYSSFYDLGVKNYAANNKDEAYGMFLKTLAVHDYVYANNLNGPNGLKFSAHDTDIVWNLVILANELKKKDDLLSYYKKIADADLADEKYAEAYDVLVKHYMKEDNKELFSKYLQKAKVHYATDPYWEAVEIEYAIKGLENEELFKKYDELLLTHPKNYMVLFNYGYELDKFIYSAEAKGKDLAAYKKKIPEVFKRAIAVNSTIDANMLLTNFYYNASFDILDEVSKIKGTKPEDVKKKNELNALNKEMLNNCIPSGEEGVRLFSELKEFKSSDKVNYKQLLDILSTVYRKNGNNAKADEYDKKRAEIK
jgi:hypothetical protein